MFRETQSSQYNNGFFFSHFSILFLPRALTYNASITCLTYCFNFHRERHWPSGLWVRSATSGYSMTCFIQNLCKWLFICPSILFNWILSDDIKFQISLPVQGWAETTIFFLRQGVSFKWKWNKSTIVDQKIGRDSDVDLKNFGFCLFSVFIYLTVQYAY